MVDFHNLNQAVERLRLMKLAECFDPVDLNSRPNSVQAQFFEDIKQYKIRLIRAGGQAGKSSSAAREIVWILEDTHPHFSRVEKWGDEPLLIIVAGQDRSMMEIELYSKKIKPLLTRPEDWREVRSGNALKHVINKKTDDRIVFLSHGNSSETDRTHLQGYVGHYVWMDELANSISIIEELQRRVEARDGFFTLTFTPKGKSGNIRQWADSLNPPIGMVYRMSRLDNPIYAERKAELLARVAGMPEGLRNTVLYGDWEIGDNAVYHFDKDLMVARPPEHYNRSWRHVEASDPAVSSKFGMTIWAEDPLDGIWYCVKADYIKDIPSPDDIVREVIKKTDNYHICRRIVDPHESWYIGMASKMGLVYNWPRNKNERKMELIKGLQEALSAGLVKIAPWCTDLIDELMGAQWAETEGKDRIIGGKKLHLSDSAQYFVDCKPKTEVIAVDKSWEQLLRDGNKERKKREAAQAQVKVGRRRWALSSSGTRRLY